MTAKTKTQSTDELDAAEQEGYCACDMGQDQGSNPYDRQTQLELWKAWDEGWQIANDTK